MSKYLVVGAGISGCTAAHALASQGHQVDVIDSGNTIGGAILGYTCKATDECSRCGVCVAHTQLHDTLQHPNITMTVGASLQSVTQNGSLNATVIRQNPSISHHACIGCDACIRACPEQCITRIQRGELVQYAIDYAVCRLHKGQQCSLCADACPTKAIFAQTATTAMSLSSDAALIATGHEPYDATRKVRFGYGRLKNVMTGVEAEELLNRQTYLRNSSDSVAFIQCVGSRDPSIGRNYCSSVCCAYAMRLARVIKYRNPDAPVTIYYIDFQNFDKTFTLFKKGVEESGVRFVRGIPFNIEQSSSSEKLRLRIENMNGEDTIVEHDVVVLSVGMGSAIESEKIAESFSLTRDDFGFFSSSSPQVFVSGTCKEPLSIPDSMAAARAIAVEMQD